MVQTDILVPMHFLCSRVGGVGFFFHPLYLAHMWRLLMYTRYFAGTGRCFRVSSWHNYSTTAQRSCCDLFIITRRQSQHKILLKIWKCFVVTLLILTYLTCRFIWCVIKFIFCSERERERESPVTRLLSSSRKHAYIILIPLNPTLYSKTGVCRGMLFFLFLIKTWILGTR